MEHLKIYPSKARLVLLTFLGIIMTSASGFVMLLFTKKEISLSMPGVLGGIIGFTIVLSISYYRTRKNLDKAEKFVSLKKQLKYLIIFVFIMGSGLIIDESIYFFIIGVIGTVFFGFCTCYSIYRIIKNTPSLEITSKGIFDNSNLMRIGQVSWNEIKDVFTYIEINNKMLAIVPYNMDEIRNRQGKIKKLFIRKQKFISVPQSTLSISVAELEEEIKSRITLNNN
ncbi:STM3941 family protein [Oceanirhabdus seepicola]|uniref:DUF5673 domain-containing protein n=1 Tax=Oceanirhabdus seepicola TaxID=2828781 RepID=A0A9J6NWT3_9CLOT|nr:STM3941 family protein [Oceanirhabdus seepicola]MCM1988723.1 hypothetical protein [Oceanirhabdus seepicola]